MVLVIDLAPDLDVADMALVPCFDLTDMDVEDVVSAAVSVAEVVRADSVGCAGGDSVKPHSKCGQQFERGWTGARAHTSEVSSQSGP